MRKIIKKAFTLVELLVVIAILASLATIGIVSYSGYTKKANEAKYNTLAKANLDKYHASNLEYPLENSYVVVSDKNQEVAWFKYNNGKLTANYEKPAEIDYNYSYGILNNANTDYIDKDVQIKQPLVNRVVDKLNTYLVDTSASTYEKIADAANNLTDLEIGALNFRESGFKFGYSLTTNKTFIMNEDCTAIKYTNTALASVPADKKTLAGANIHDAQDLIEFSNLSNKSTDREHPDADNIYIVDNPIVVCNIKNDITFSNTDKFVPMANWYIFAHAGNKGTPEYYFDIHLLLNGNNKKINSLTSNGFIGALKAGSIIRDVTVNYAMGTVESPVTLSGRNDDVLSKYEGYGYWHCGLFISSLHQNSNSSLTTISNVNLTGTINIAPTNTEGSLNTCGVVLGTFLNQNNNNILLTLKNCNFFSQANDYVKILKIDDKSGIAKDSFGFVVGSSNYYNGTTNAEKISKGLYIENCTFNSDIETNTPLKGPNRMYGSNDDPILWAH